MRVLVAYGPRMSGTAGIAELIAPVPQVQELLEPIGARGWAAEVAIELVSLDLPGRLHA